MSHTRSFGGRKVLCLYCLDFSSNVLCLQQLAVNLESLSPIRQVMLKIILNSSDEAFDYTRSSSTSA